MFLLKFKKKKGKGVSLNKLSQSVRPFALSLSGMHEVLFFIETP